jgi:hypothetical protein
MSILEHSKMMILKGYYRPIIRPSDRYFTKNGRFPIVSWEELSGD